MGKPVVASWSYSWCAGLGDFSSSWTAPVDVSRVPIEVDAHEIAGRQMQAVINALPTGIEPLFAFDAGYDSTRLAEQVDEVEAAVLVRLRRNRCFYAEPLDKQRSADLLVTALSSFAMTLRPGHSLTLNTLKMTRATAGYAFVLGVAFMHVFKTILDAVPVKPSLSSEGRSCYLRSPSCLERPVSLELSGCGGEVPENLIWPLSGALTSGVLPSSTPSTYLDC